MRPAAAAETTARPGMASIAAVTTSDRAMPRTMRVTMREGFLWTVGGWSGRRLARGRPRLLAGVPRWPPVPRSFPVPGGLRSPVPGRLRKLRLGRLTGPRPGRVRVDPPLKPGRCQVDADLADVTVQVPEDALPVAETAQHGLVLIRWRGAEQGHHAFHLRALRGAEREDTGDTVRDLFVQQVTGVLRDEDQRGVLRPAHPRDLGHQLGAL